jgi:hypothetical protein
MSDVSLSGHPVGPKDGHNKTFMGGYARQILWSWDARLAYAGTAAGLSLLGASPPARANLDAVASSGVAVSALGLTFVLASMSLLSGLLDADVIEVLDGLEK